MPRHDIAYIWETVARCQRVTNFLPKENPVAPFVVRENLFFEVDDVGLIAIVPVDEALAHAHITFWDGRLRGREELCTAVADWVHYVSQRLLFTVIPETHEKVLAFCKRVGFHERARTEGIVTLVYPNYPE
jgi:hypothetical protein